MAWNKMLILGIIGALTPAAGFVLGTRRPFPRHYLDRVRGQACGSFSDLLLGTTLGTAIAFGLRKCMLKAPKIQRRARSQHSQTHLCASIARENQRFNPQADELAEMGMPSKLLVAEMGMPTDNSLASCMPNLDMKKVLGTVFKMVLALLISQYLWTLPSNQVYFLACAYLVLRLCRGRR
mmetsp:Transcript_48813/g.87903  ORF Transcript_48813/g.87903 Transcript_48813/m.87903 type:complete len:180 (-) Transcript_48813:192-731(-)